IQNRAGCSCAGPYGHRLLGISADVSARYRALVTRGYLGVKPGWVRLSIPYYADDEEVAFLLRAVEFVADRGDTFLPEYRLRWKDGIWRHVDRPMRDVHPIELTPEALTEAATRFGRGDSRSSAAPEPEDVKELRASYLDEAARIADELD